MNIKEVAHNHWEVYNGCALQRISVIDLRNANTGKLYWQVSFSSFNGKHISIKKFNSETDARNFAEQFIALLNQEAIHND